MARMNCSITGVRLGLAALGDLFTTNPSLKKGQYKGSFRENRERIGSPLADAGGNGAPGLRLRRPVPA